MRMDRITIQNRTGGTLVPYLVVRTARGLVRQAQPAQSVPAGGSYQVDPDGWNPVFYGERGEQRRGVLVEIGSRSDPPVLVSTVYAYKVPPGQSGENPTLQPTTAGRFPLRVGGATQAVTVAVLPGFVVRYTEHDAAATAGA